MYISDAIIERVYWNYFSRMACDGGEILIGKLQPGDTGNMSPVCCTMDVEV